MLRKLSVAALAALFVMPTAADTRMGYVDENSGDEQTVITIADGKVRADNSGSPSWTLFDAGDDSLIAVDPAGKTWTSLDEETLQKAAGQMDAAMARMREQLAKLPPDQRARMEKMMEGLTGAGRQMMQMKVDRTGKTLHKAGRDCAQVLVSVGTVSRSEMCVVDPDELDIPAADRKALDAMQARMKKFAESMSKSFGANLAFDFDSLGGIPVYMKKDGDDAGQVLKGVSHAAVSAEVFRIPDGYRERKIGAD